MAMPSPSPRSNETTRTPSRSSTSTTEAAWPSPESLTSSLCVCGRSNRRRATIRIGQSRNSTTMVVIKAAL